MRSWAVQDAKARFSEMLEACVKDGPQLVTKRGENTAILVPLDEWRRMQEQARPTLKDLLLSEKGRGDFKMPKRGRIRLRPPPTFD